MNRYNEQLVFNTVDDKVPNRGITQDRTARADQLVANARLRADDQADRRR